MYTITLNGNSNEMSCDIFPPLEVKNTSQLCLLSLQTNNSIPNIEHDFNTIGFRDSFGKCVNVTIPTADGTTLKCSMTCSYDTDFTIEHNISKILGFENKVYSAKTKHESERIVNIMKTIHDFFPSSPPGHKIIEVPKYLVFYRLNSTSISKVNIVPRDQDNSLINLRG
ncbi:Uncharacterized protein FWK35_00028356 [Aphis craccivora]|uniref:Uncharacterized protein n=1 Tax=Aphis craccivora TaxID=307492 RepID=A0A6G0VUL3_APHCR|nr:Uncharacterized protein FWK35_00028356 [Aphis craccivora]